MQSTDLCIVWAGANQPGAWEAGMVGLSILIISCKWWVYNLRGTAVVCPGHNSYCRQTHTATGARDLEIPRGDPLLLVT